MPKNTIKAFGPFGFNAANLLATWQQMATSASVKSTPYPAVKLIMSNASNTSVAIAYNGDPTAIQTLRPEADLILPFQANNQPNNKESVLAAGTTFFIAGTAGVGFIYITIYY
jgi:hypothetical protein